MEQRGDALRGAQRARWLAELSDALEAADRLFRKAGSDPRECVAAMDLYLRIQGARMQVHALRLYGHSGPPAEFNPQWTEISPWHETAAADQIPCGRSPPPE